ncbi:MAG: phosphoesterase [Planctomycetota bacterium]|jgi:hypothetical protein
MRLNKGKSTVLVIPDLQIPYEHKDALEFIMAVEEMVTPDEIVCIGDEVDQMALSRFDPDPEGDGAGPELRKAVRKMKKWYSAFPEVKVCTSNHTGRIQKKAFHAGIPEAYMRPVNEWMEAPKGWDWKDAHVIDGVKYEHGDAQGGMYAARNLAMRNRQSTVIGHHHSHGAVFYVANNKEMIFGMNAGCLIDVDSIAFKYGRMSAYRPTLGCGIVTEGVPTFVPMLIKANKRWTGEVIL